MFKLWVILMIVMLSVVTTLTVRQVSKLEQAVSALFTTQSILMNAGEGSR